MPYKGKVKATYYVEKMPESQGKSVKPPSSKPEVEEKLEKAKEETEEAVEAVEELKEELE